MLDNWKDLIRPSLEVRRLEERYGKFELEVNTTNVAQTAIDPDLEAGVYARVKVGGLTAGTDAVLALGAQSFVRAQPTPPCDERLPGRFQLLGRFRRVHGAGA